MQCQRDVFSCVDTVFNPVYIALMLNRLPRTTESQPAWIVRDLYARSDSKTCWVVQVGESRFVPGGCDECERSDTLVDLNTRREDDGDCARCGAKGASIYFDGCRDSLTLLHFVAIAIFGEAPEETRKCDRCNLVMGHDYFRNDGDDVCAYCLTAAEVRS